MARHGWQWLASDLGWLGAKQLSLWPKFEEQSPDPPMARHGWQWLAIDLGWWEAKQLS